MLMTNWEVFGDVEWYWRMRMGLLPHPEDRDALRRIASELFGLEHERLSPTEPERQSLR
jgi:hypothetical protein